MDAAVTQIHQLLESKASYGFLSWIRPLIDLFLSIRKRSGAKVPAVGWGYVVDS